MFESLTTNTKNQHQFLKVRIGNESNGEFIYVQDAIWDTGVTQFAYQKMLLKFLIF